MLTNLGYALRRIPEYTNTPKQKRILFAIHVLIIIGFVSAFMWAPTFDLMFNLFPRMHPRLVLEQMIGYFLFIRPWRKIKSLTWSTGRNGLVAIGKLLTVTDTQRAKTLAKEEAKRNNAIIENANNDRENNTYRQIIETDDDILITID